MTVSQLLAEYGKVGLIALILSGGLIQISPLKINPWSWLFNKITGIFNRDLKEKINILSQNSEKEFDKINSSIEKLEETLSKISCNFNSTKEALGVLTNRIDELENTSNNIIQADEMNKAEDARRNVLIFDSEIRRGQMFTQEYWTEMLRYIDIYEDYCESHPRYSNTKAVSSIENVKNTYIDCLKNNNFIGQY